MTTAPFPIRKQKEPVSRTCATCGDRKCRRKFKAVCWLHCGWWIKELLPLEAVPSENQNRKEAYICP